MTLSDFDYTLPPENIAQTPMEPRDHSKLLIIDRETQSFTDKHFYDLADLLGPKDVLVINNTKVFPARLLVHKVDSASLKPVELLLEKEAKVTADSISWDAMTKPGLKVGDRIEIPQSHVTGICTAVHGYTRRIQFSISREHFFVTLDKWAKTPIPPYIRWEGKDEEELRARYQTVYAKRTGAMAAPTAGLHFTPELFCKLRASGVQIEEVTLHVGLGTFLPVKTNDITHHEMHSEWFELRQPVATSLNEAKQSGKRIIAVGTTVVRVLETCSDSYAKLYSQTGTTDIFIYPPYSFKFVDSIITNFHTPKSTLLMLISAFVSSLNAVKLPPDDPYHRVARRLLPKFVDFRSSLIGKAYQHALEKNYRFYSFGDSMWIR